MINKRALFYDITRHLLLTRPFNDNAYFRYYACIFSSFSLAVVQHAL